MEKRKKNNWTPVGGGRRNPWPRYEKGANISDLLNKNVWSKDENRQCGGGAQA